MPDTLRQLGQNIGRTYREVDHLNHRGGYLPQTERTRGNLYTTAGYIANFNVITPVRRVGLKLTFYKASIL